MKNQKLFVTNTCKNIRKSNKVNNQKVTIKVSEEIKRKMEAQKQIENIKFDYELINILLERNLESYSPKDRNKYNVILDIE